MSMVGYPVCTATGSARKCRLPSAVAARVPTGALSPTSLPTSARVAVLAVALVAGCASGPPKPTVVGGTVQAAANVNPSVSKRPSPLLVRIYELKSGTAFGSADFVSLYQGDQAVLGSEMVSRDEFVLNPGDSRKFQKLAAPETHFIGVFAAYRDLDRAKWRSLVAVQPNQTQAILIRADELAITATAVPPAGR